MKLQIPNYKACPATAGNRIMKSWDLGVLRFVIMLL